MEGQPMGAESADAETALRASMSAALDLSDTTPVRIGGEATLDSAYPVSDLATASVTTAAVATAQLCTALGFDEATVSVDRALCDAWFGMALTPVGWTIPSPWDAIAGDYPTADGGWIRLHTNAPHHRAAALRVLGADGERERVAAAVAAWTGDDLENAIVAQRGCAAVLRRPAEWAAHPQGVAVASETLVATEAAEKAPDAAASPWDPSPYRPLAGLRVLDLTRVLAGPVATRLLAGLGADVLRIDPPGWDEPAVVPEMTIGKRTARLDARDPSGRMTLLGLLAGADVLVHGYRADALELLGLGDAVRRATRPGLIEVALDAYGWSGPWRTRRGFDSLVQMSSGIAGSGLHRGTADRPTPLPVQALDHATGYLMAAATLAGLARRVRDGRGSVSRLSLARTALELERVRPLRAQSVQSRLIAEAPHEREPVTASVPLASPIDTPWGAATLLPSPFSVGTVHLGWTRGPRALGADAPSW
jgi:crotonobetainyl-CoA:carnitine CoA-transferase CaiB-like acyl-CoA transferase